MNASNYLGSQGVLIADNQREKSRHFRGLEYHNWHENDCHDWAKVREQGKLVQISCRISESEVEPDLCKLRALRNPLLLLRSKTVDFMAFLYFPTDVQVYPLASFAVRTPLTLTTYSLPTANNNVYQPWQTTQKTRAYLHELDSNRSQRSKILHPFPSEVMQSDLHSRTIYKALMAHRG